MINTLFLIGGLAVVLGLAYLVIGRNYKKYLKNLASSYQLPLLKADMSIEPEDYLLRVAAIALLPWLVLIFVFQPIIPVSIALIPLVLGIVLFLGNVFLKFKGGRRVGAFVDQLEPVLRMLSGSLRVGLGLRQALVMVTEEMKDPARREFMRVVGRSNLGIPLADALDELAKAMPSKEMTMFVRSVRINQTTGGDLSKVLDKLSNTIRDRRRILRKINALTAQGRFGGAIIGALPLLIGAFVMTTQHDMADALLHTLPGYAVLGTVVLLEAGAFFVLSKILKLDV